MIAIENDHLITTREAANISGLSKMYLSQLAQTGVVQAQKLQREWLISSNSLMAYLALPRKRGPRKKAAVA